MFNELGKNFNADGITQIICSSPISGNPYNKQIIRPVNIKNIPHFQIEKLDGKQAFHQNILRENLLNYIRDNITDSYNIIDVTEQNQSIRFQRLPNGKIIKKITNVKKSAPVSFEHNKEKDYILKEGAPIRPLVELGIFTPDFRVVKSKYDKYKQINRFVETIDDMFKKSQISDDFTIVDFGCGKSYLTFILYYYFTEIRKINVNIFGYDLKADVVSKCQNIAESFGYSRLKFQCADIANIATMPRIDMIVTLHACDTATDLALFHAIRQNVKYIFSVPCCQHEINAQIKSDNEFGVLLEHGLIKERFSALITDAVRCEILKNYGYSVDVIEFVDFEHSPKNLMIRAEKKNNKIGDLSAVSKLLSEFHTSQKLMELLKG